MHELSTLRLDRIRKNLFFIRTTVISLIMACLLVGLFLSKAANAGTVDISLSDSTNQAQLRNTKITAYEVSSSGTLTWRGSGTTNSSGRLILNLTRLGTGKKFILKTDPFGTGSTQSKSFTKTGRFNYRVGSVHAKLIQASNSKTLTNHKAMIYEVINGTRKWRGAGNTDVNGIIRFSPKGIAQGNRKFEISTRSLYDKKQKTSSKITQPGNFSFLVGNKLLKVRLVNRHNGKIVPNREVIVYKRLSSGNQQRTISKTTNSQGLTDFDLPGLGSGDTYILQSNPYGAGRAYSANIKSTGKFDFKVGALQFTVLRGSNNAVLKNFPVELYEKDSNNHRKGRASGKTNTQGKIWFDPVPVKKGSTLYLTAKNPFDGTRKYSSNVNHSGRYLFKVGNELLNVSVINKQNRKPLAETPVTVYKQLSNGQLDRITQETTNANGRFDLDLDGLGQGTNYVLKANPYGTGLLSSKKITQPGRFDFAAGALQFTIIRGSNGSLLKSFPVTLYRKTTNGRTRLSSGLTDSKGKIWFDPPSSGTANRLFLVAKSPFDSKYKQSRPVNASGRHEFVVGNKLLRVNLQHALTGSKIPNKAILAYKIQSDGTAKFTAKKSANSNGLAIFDLAGLGSGQNYFLKTKPFNNQWLQSQTLSNTGSFNFKAGAITITLKKTKKGTVLPGRQIILYEKTPSGGRKSQGAAITDSRGRVFFDPSGLKQGRIYYAYTQNVFGKNNRYYSTWITAKGNVNFDVDPNGDTPPDFKPPILSISSPSSGSKVSDAGFVLRGLASDNDKVEKIIVAVSAPSVGTTTANANIKNGYWNFPIKASMIKAKQTATLLVKAYDPSKNEAVSTLKVSVISDDKKPFLQILSHKTADTVPHTGFLLSGTVKDNTEISNLAANVIDSKRGTVIKRSNIDIAPHSGNWALAVRNLSINGTVSVSVTAHDAAGNKENKSISLKSIPATKEALHIINRVTFGATPQLLKQVRNQGVDTFINRQLHPGKQDTQTLARALKSIGKPTSKHGLQDFFLAHAIYSQWQLREVMTWFWENHFNTDISKVSNSGYELSENRAFRSHALGRFRTLLETSASSPAMLIYLDNHQSRFQDPNENYARELMELHTMGVKGGYVPKDIVEVARVFTGWRVANRKFNFDSRLHDSGAKVILGRKIPANSGISGGRQVLDILAQHPSTAKFICSKLIKVFVSDTPARSTIDKCASQYFAHYNKPDQIARMLSWMLKSNEFQATQHFHSKVKTPFEFVAGVVRNFDATINIRDNRIAIGKMGMPLLFSASPTGWPEIGERWINTNQLRQRLQFSTRITFNNPNPTRTYLDNPIGFFQRNGVETADGVVGYLFELAFANDYTTLEWNEAIKILTNNGRSPFDIKATDANIRIRKLLGTTMAYPSYQLQ